MRIKILTVIILTVPFLFLTGCCPGMTNVPMKTTGVSASPLYQATPTILPTSGTSKLNGLLILMIVGGIGLTIFGIGNGLGRIGGMVALTGVASIVVLRVVLAVMKVVDDHHALLGWLSLGALLIGIIATISSLFIHKTPDGKPTLLTLNRIQTKQERTQEQ